VKKIRVLVVDDSFVCRELLRELLEADDDIEVVGEAATGEEAVELVRDLKPDVATMDVQMPGLGGLKAIEQIMAKTPVPILVVTGRPASSREDLAFEAVRRGALDLVEKPHPDEPRAGHGLRVFVRRFADVRVVRHVAGNRQAPAADPPAPPEAKDGPRVAPPAAARAAAPAMTVVGLGASAGGPLTLANVLSGIDPEARAAFALVQHLPLGFVDSFAEFLARRIPQKVRVVRSHARLEAGVVFFAADDHHLAMTDPQTIASVEGPRVGGHRPSVDTLFQSMADFAGALGVGVVLSGMGSDGARGLRRMSAAGAYTIAQDESTSIVYGMPRAAVEAGGVKSVLPLQLIAPTLNALLSPQRAARGREGGR
jgi:two-component system, chemotaxis family, protein-glutamate methylesterase/glutaminase